MFRGQGDRFVGSAGGHGQMVGRGGRIAHVGEGEGCVVQALVDEWGGKTDVEIVELGAVLVR